MGEIFAVRNLDGRTIEYVKEYAQEHKLNTAEALQELIILARMHLREKVKKTHTDIFDVYDKIKFTTNEPNLSKNIDKILYSKVGR